MTKTILVVDDEKDVADTLERLLVGEGFHVKVAYGGKEAIDLIENEHFDIVITDIHMPGIDGFEVMRCVKAKNEETRVIVLTGCYLNTNAKEFLRNNGVFDYISKPIENIDTFLSVVRETFERRRLSIGKKHLEKSTR
ncbi:MAG: response regulator [Thermodesulfobacteriota bacterium]